jgi:hypothetical protein
MSYGLRFEHHREFSIGKALSHDLGRVIAESCYPRVTRLQCETAGECGNNYLIADLVLSPTDLRDQRYDNPRQRPVLESFRKAGSCTGQ